ncbi:cytidylyltransferase domain-containing protein [Leminorella richardii]|uniref:acylneuraminate cytidylyltransferase family protein n=1 Tax=Leminorella richardii TaxID=158841 RepID=UPI002F96D7EF
MVSTDSEEYKSIAEKYGAEVILREKELASDTATSFMVVKDVLSRIEVKPHYFVLLQPTSPFRNSKHIRDAVNIYENNTLANYLVSVTESEKSSSLIKEINDFSMRNYDIDYSGYRRQKHKEYYPNGAIFIGDVDSYLKKKAFFWY